MLPEDDTRIRNVSEHVLSDDWCVLRKARFEFLGKDGDWHQQERESYDRGNGSVVLLHNPGRHAVLLTRQFRWPAYANGHPDGMLIEVCAGVLDGDDPETAIRRETWEETGVEIDGLRPLFTAYMSPGSVTERLHFFYATYDDDQRRGEGGGIPAEGEEIETIELKVDKALEMVRSGAIVDAKTIMLLQWLAIEQPDG